MSETKPFVFHFYQDGKCVAVREAPADTSRKDQAQGLYDKLGLANAWLADKPGRRVTVYGPMLPVTSAAGLWWRLRKYPYHDFYAWFPRGLWNGRVV